MTKIWGSIQGAPSYADVSINALGDIRGGCDSLGPAANPNVSVNGTPQNGVDPSNGDPGALGRVGDGNIEFSSDLLDLSGTHSIVKRSMVVTIPEQEHGYQKIPAQRIACCVIGHAAGPEKPSYGHND